ncbi:hypothetical protein BASA81_005192 [Batrachochytrium salamandrivorans]|nr:hypothetical protein BASA81_005192 [Batrachochytrium salamandrivorans]
MGQYLAMEHFTLEQWEEFFMYDLERMLLLLDDQSRARGFEISTKVTIMDLSGIGMGMITRLKLLKMANAIMSQHYPEVAGPIFMFNAPWTFSTMYALAQPMLDEDTQKKLVVSSKFDFDLLDRVIGDVQDVIPVEFGGSNLQTLRACAHAPQ